ncbi:MAG: hypothetical protein ACWGQW_09880 [bacterium]
MRRAAIDEGAVRFYNVRSYDPVEVSADDLVTASTPIPVLGLPE